MNERVSAGEHWKMQLLTGQSKAAEATDILLESRLELSDAELLQVILPMAELRASQLEAGLSSTDAATRAEAERMHARYSRPLEVPEAHEAAQALGGAVSPLTRAVAGNWLGKVLENDRVGEMEKELDRTVETYKTQQQHNVLRLNHAQAMAR